MDGKKQKSGVITIKHVVDLRRGKPVRLSIECGELVVRLEEISLLHKQVSVSIECAAGPPSDSQMPVSVVVLAARKAMYASIYRMSAN